MSDNPAARAQPDPTTIARPLRRHLLLLISDQLSGAIPATPQGSTLDSLHHAVEAAADQARAQALTAGWPQPDAEQIAAITRRLGQDMNGALLLHVATCRPTR